MYLSWNKKTRNQEQEDIKPSQPDSYSGLMCVVWRGINKSVYVRLVIRSVNILVSEIEIKQYKRLLGFTVFVSIFGFLGK